MAYTLSVRDPLPIIPIPLRPGDPEPTLALNQLLHDLYDRARYDLAIDYSQPPVPPLHDDDTALAAPAARRSAARLGLVLDRRFRDALG